MQGKNLKEMQASHEIICEFTYEPAVIKRGYADRSLKIDLTTNKISILPVTEQMKELWTGGRGFDLWYMFNEINKNTKWDSPENPICFSSGPLGGTASFPGSGKTLITTISPATDIVIDSNVGGHFGPYFKFAGFDCLVVTGKAQENTIVLIDAQKRKITIEKAPLESVDSHLVAEEFTEMYADDDIDKRNIAVVSAGNGAKHTRMGILNFSFWDWRRNVARLKQAGRGGVGTVFCNKNLKAIIIRGNNYTPAWRIEESKVALETRPSKVCTCPSQKNKIIEIAEKWNKDHEYIIEMLQDIQDSFGFISKTAIDELSHLMGLSKAHLYHIATFYKAFSLEEKGESIIQVCMGTACHVKGAKRVLETFEQILGIKCGQTTVDKKYTLESVACLGACSISPVVKINDEIIGNVQAKDVAKILSNQKTAMGGNDNA